MNHLTSLLALTFATRRATRLVMDDEITRPIRDYLHSLNSPKLSYFITCPWCTSIWTAASLLALYKAHPELADFVSTILALSETSNTLDSFI